ncbi:MAG: DUF1573 domain-containing protein [Bacteroidia bacterium]
MISRWSYLSLFVLVLGACTPNNQDFTTEDIIKSNPEERDPNAPKGSITFEDTAADFGNIVDGAKIEHIFAFKNTGKGPVSIARVRASCGCTTPSWTQEVIPAGGEGKIVAVFNSSGRGGPDNPLVEKHIDVQFENAERNQFRLMFRSHILKK